MMAQTLAYFAEIEPVRPGDCVLHAAPIRTVGLLRAALCCQGANTIIPESAGLDLKRSATLLPMHGNVSFFRRRHG